MATEPSTSQPVAAAATPAEQLVVNLQVVSPSVGVNRPLLFPDLPATTTVKGLKDKIRQTLPLRPADENQRLIHRGRALLRESDSLLDIFGADTLRAPERQTIHLVIRDLSDSQTPTPSTTARGPSPVAGGRSTSASRASPSPHPIATPPHFGPDTSQRRATFQTFTQPVPQLGRIPSPAPAPAHQHHTPEQAAAFQHHHQNMANWLSQVQRDAHLQREAMVRAFVSQNQRGRAQMGMRGIGDTTGNNVTESNNGRASPVASHSVHYESVGPNGQSYQVDTVIRAATHGPTAGLSLNDVQNIIRGADANQATMAMASAMQRSVSATSIHNRPLAQPGVTTPVFGSGGSLAGSGRATPDLEPRVPGAGNNSTNPASLPPSQTQQGLQVYILSSPEGPRALLLNTTAAETYYSPRLRSQLSLPRLRGNVGPSDMAFASQAHVSQAHVPHAAQQHHQEPPAQHEPPAAVHAQPPVQNLHPHNPPAAALPPLLLQLWPHIWLIFRLGFFVWLFTTPNSSWSRWLTIICLAVFIFVLSTGLLNGIAENAWRPIGRHLEQLLPDLQQMQGGRAAAPHAGAGAQQAGRQDDTAPEQLAARLVEERRARGWLAGHVRRLERAGLLFLASIAPGVAERHIANLEAEARAEENRRREAEAAAAAAAARTGEEGENESGDRNETDTHEDDIVRPDEQRNGHGHEDARRGNPGEEPIRDELVAL